MPNNERGLILSRKKQESILIGDEIEIQVTALKGNRVSLRIKAPRAMKVLRKEIQEQEADDQKEKELAGEGQARGAGSVSVSAGAGLPVSSTN